MPLIYYPNPLLRKAAARVDVIDDEIRRIAAEMISICLDPKSKGIGLGANQIGVLKRIIVLLVNGPEVCINPEISSPYGEFTHEEGCLSHPRIKARITRPRSFTFTYTDLDNNRHEEQIESTEVDIRGTVIQHEVDHINGINLIDRMNAVQLHLVDKKLAALRKEWR